MKRLIRSVALLLLAPSMAAAQFAKADTAALRRTLDAIVKAHHGVVGYSISNIDTGERLSLRGDETFSTASLIKVPILVTLYDLVEKNQLALSDPLTVLKIDQVPGSGVLQFMKPGMILTVGDAAKLMIILSDNTATNLILDRVAIRRVWDKMEALGLPHTKVHSKTFQRMTSVAMDSSVKYGLGVTTPNEMARLFALLAEGKAVSAKADSTMLDILAHNEDYASMQRHVEALTVPQDRRDGSGAHGVRALPSAVARRGVRADEGERRPAVADRQRGPGDAGEHGPGDRRGVAEKGREVSDAFCALRSGLGRYRFDEVATQ